MGIHILHFRNTSVINISNTYCVIRSSILLIFTYNVTNIYIIISLYCQISQESQKNLHATCRGIFEFLILITFYSYLFAVSYYKFYSFFSFKA